MMPEAAEAPMTPEAPTKVICISQQPDGSFSVYPEGEEAQEGAPAGQPAASLDEALQVAAQMFSADGRSPEEAAMAGYNKGAQAPKPSPAQVFGG